MQVFDKLVNVGKLSLALGFFDGVHIAHQKLISSCVEYAQKNNLKSAVLTFKDHPLVSVFNVAPEYITSYQQRLDAISNLGVDFVFVLNFDNKLCNTKSLDFLTQTCDFLTPNAIFTGYNFSFGKDKMGSPDELEQFSKQFGYKYFKVPKVTLDNISVSSTNIRNFLKAGDIFKANTFLGHEFCFQSKVIEGEKIGRTIGFPTTNLIYPNNVVQLKFGVYSVKVKIGDKFYKGIMNYGLKPTVQKIDKLSIEVHILDFSDNIYGSDLIIYPTKFLREQKKFDSLDDLKNQIFIDISKLE